ncbi:MAG TPA: hypothetical protein VNN99_03055 [Vicinamibacterales bacterium]|nr:hypothetical protein [Vicinamibacterales bacterium]
MSRPGPRVRIFPGGAEARIGDERYEVEWQEMTAAGQKRHDADPNRDHDPDRDERHVREYCATLEQARTKAAAIVAGGTTVYGVATVTRQVVDYIDGGPRDVGEWNDVGDPEYVD